MCEQQKQHDMVDHVQKSKQKSKNSIVFWLQICRCNRAYAQLYISVFNYLYIRFRTSELGYFWNILQVLNNIPKTFCLFTWIFTYTHMHTSSCNSLFFTFHITSSKSPLWSLQELSLDTKYLRDSSINLLMGKVMASRNK